MPVLIMVITSTIMVGCVGCVSSLLSVPAGMALHDKACWLQAAWEEGRAVMAGFTLLCLKTALCRRVQGVLAGAVHLVAASMHLKVYT